ncbi:hypothetical protein HDV05_002579, partial [Chytridiales sp. JEL 0842]
MKFVEFVRSKDEIGTALRQLILRLETQSSLKVQRVRSDKGTEFLSSFLDWLKDRGTIHEQSPEYQKEYNGLCERGVQAINQRDSERRKYHGSLGILVGYVGDTIPRIYDFGRRKLVDAVHVRYHEDRYPGIHYNVAQLLHALDLPTTQSPSITSDEIVAIWTSGKDDGDNSPTTETGSGETSMTSAGTNSHYSLRPRFQSTTSPDESLTTSELGNTSGDQVNQPMLEASTPLDASVSESIPSTLADQDGELIPPEPVYDPAEFSREDDDQLD